MVYEDLLDLIKARRTVRSFRPDPVPEEFVEKIIEAARWAPSGANSQPWEFIVVRQDKTKNAILEILKEHSEYARKVELTRPERMRWPSAAEPQKEPGFKDAPVWILVCGDPRTRQSYPLLTMLSRGDSHFASSLANAFLYMCLAATALGLGCQWVSATGHPFPQSLIKRLLDIPEPLIIYDMMALGYPAHQPKPRLVRSLAEIVHRESYDRRLFRDDEQVTRFIMDLRK